VSAPSPSSPSSSPSGRSWRLLSGQPSHFFTVLFKKRRQSASSVADPDP
jgi:hypothetical protein